jgi:hypothetical protein
MKTLVAMRRANGDWYALDDKGGLRVPIFLSQRDAMVARSRDPGMECFRPTVLDEAAYKNLTTTDQGSACFWIIEDPLRRLSLGRPFDQKQLATLRNSNGLATASSGVSK